MFKVLFHIDYNFNEKNNFKAYQLIKIMNNYTNWHTKNVCIMCGTIKSSFFLSDFK
tara:strand:- start:265 stop:432 length:168 start_codon:yes stop_codon:yes gene_type:complete